MVSLFWQQKAGLVQCTISSKMLKEPRANVQCLRHWICESLDTRPATHGYTEVRSDLTHILHDELRWLKCSQRVTFKLCTPTVYKCLHGLATQCLCLSELWFIVNHKQLTPTPLCKPTTSILALQHNKLRPTYVFLRWPSRLELTSWKCAKINIYCHLHALSKDVFTVASLGLVSPGATTDHSFPCMVSPGRSAPPPSDATACLFEQIRLRIQCLQIQIY